MANKRAVSCIRRLREGHAIDHGEQHRRTANLGSNELARLTSSSTLLRRIAGITVKRRYNLAAPKGVNGRNSDNTLIQNVSAGSLPSVCAMGLRDLRVDLRSDGAAGFLRRTLASQRFLIRSAGRRAGFHFSLKSNRNSEVRTSADRYDRILSARPLLVSAIQSSVLHRHGHFRGDFDHMLDA